MSYFHPVDLYPFINLPGPFSISRFIVFMISKKVGFIQKFLGAIPAFGILKLLCFVLAKLYYVKRFSMPVRCCVATDRCIVVLNSTVSSLIISSPEMGRVLDLPSNRGRFYFCQTDIRPYISVQFFCDVPKPHRS